VSNGVGENVHDFWSLVCGFGAVEEDSRALVDDYQCQVEDGINSIIFEMIQPFPERLVYA
jgi:hypothetical protein